MPSIVEDLQVVLKLKPKAKETQAAFAERLARKANDMENDDWETLSQETQVWVNAAIEAIGKSQALPLPDGIATALPEAVAEEAPAAKPKGKTAAPAAKPVKTPAKADAPSTRGPKGKFGAEDAIEIVPETNPFREGTKCHTWFGKITDGMTVKQAVEAGAPRHHIRWAHTLGHLKIGA